MLALLLILSSWEERVYSIFIWIFYIAWWKPKQQMHCLTYFKKELRHNNHIDFTFNHYRLQLKGGTTCFGSQFEDRAHRNGGSRV